MNDEHQNNHVRSVPAVRRAAGILAHLAARGGGCSLSEIARELKIFPSTCLHILRELIAAGLVSFESNGKLYGLGPSILVLASHLNRNDIFVRNAQLLLDEITRKYKISSIGSLVDKSGHIVVVAAANTSGPIHFETGNRVPALSSATGRCVAAFSNWSPETLKERFARVRWERAPDFKKWLKEVEATRKRGHSIDRGDFFKGLTVVAAPVTRADGSAIHFISATVISAHLKASDEARIVTVVKQAAAQLSRILG
jgi:DNA-binding IclR family transcriptional regulator